MLHASLLVAAIFTFNSVTAQCDLKVKITPSQPILCPQSSDTLSTTEAYDSYQWFRGNDPIAGATSRYFIVNEKDIGHRYKVVVTRNACADTSKKVYIDGWAFLPPYLVLSGDIEKFDPRKEAFVLCPKDTVVMTMGLPYNQSIQWYNNGVAIKGANSPDFMATKTGSYYACGAPDVCPNYISCVGVATNIFADNPTITIEERNDTLFATGGKKFKWSVNGKEIPGANENYLVPKISGRYMAASKDEYKCAAVSTPFVYKKNTGIKLISVSPNPVHDLLHLKIESAAIVRIVISDFNGNIKIQAVVSGADQQIAVQSLKTGSYILRGLDKDGRQIETVVIIKQ